LTNPTENQSPSSGELRAPADEAAPATPSTLHRIFMGPDGLRAGWGLLIFIGLFAAIAYSLHFIVHKLHLSVPDASTANSAISPLVAFFAEALNFSIVLLITWVMSKIERRPISVYGFEDKRRFAHFFAGLIWGIVCLSLLVLTLWKAGLLIFDGRALFAADIFRYGAAWLLVFLLVGLFEENLNRGYVQYRLTRGLTGLYQRIFETRHSAALGFWTSAIIFSILFGLGHTNNPGESPLGLLSAGLGGMVFCLSLWRTGSLWWAIGFHTSWDWAQSFVYGVPDSGLLAQHHLLATHAVGKPILSGGTTGPEGSIFIVGVLALVALIIFFTLPHTNYGRAAK
jgi:uncharacterized protein